MQRVGREPGRERGGQRLREAHGQEVGELLVTVLVGVKPLGQRGLDGRLRLTMVWKLVASTRAADA